MFYLIDCTWSKEEQAQHEGHGAGVSQNTMAG